MSLLSSIFGAETPAATTSTKNVVPDLFAKVSVAPANLDIPKTSQKKSKKKEGSHDKDENGSSSSDSDGESSTSSTQQPITETKAETENNNEVAKPSLNPSKKKTREELKEEESRTIFVGNLPPTITRRALAAIFKSCGNVLSARLRSQAVTGVKLPPEQAGNQNMMRKVCANTGLLQTDTPKKNAQGYVVFESKDSIPSALLLNNTTYAEHSIRVDHANPTIEPNRSIFVGNLPYGADEETLRSHFVKSLNDVEDLNESEGSAVSGVRIIRDKETQKCKGFGYVMLRDATLVPLALGLHESVYMKRELRVMVCGKRTKGNRGREDAKSGEGRGKRSFEGQRATASGASSTKKRKSEGSFSPGNVGGKTNKKRRSRSDKKAFMGSGGKSKRAATEQKVNKRVKKLQKRVIKGMGKKSQKA